MLNYLITNILRQNVSTVERKCVLKRLPSKGDVLDGSLYCRVYASLLSMLPAVLHLAAVDSVKDTKRQGVYSHSQPGGLFIFPLSCSGIDGTCN